MDLRKKLSNFGVNLINDFICNSQKSLRESPEAPFNWELLLIDIMNAMGVSKKNSILSITYFTPALPKPPVIREVLLHTEVVVDN